MDKLISSPFIRKLTDNWKSEIGRSLLQVILERRGAKVDFVLKRGRALHAIEVKSGRKKSTKGQQVFCEKFRRARPVIITPENYPEFEADPIGFVERV